MDSREKQTSWNQSLQKSDQTDTWAVSHVRYPVNEGNHTYRAQNIEIEDDSQDFTLER